MILKLLIILFLQNRLKNIGNILKAAGCNFKDVVRVDMFLINIDDFTKVNEIYATFFQSDPKPARQTIEVSKLPKGASIEISKLPAPVYLSRTAENTYTALSMLCTHKACELNPTGNFLTCPCHGSEFSNIGKVLKPPAGRALTKYRVTTDDSIIYIHLKQ